MLWYFLIYLIYLIYLICRSKSEDFGLSRSQFHFFCWNMERNRNSQKQTQLRQSRSNMFQGAHRGWGCFGSLGCTGPSPEYPKSRDVQSNSSESGKAERSPMFQRCSTKDLLISCGFLVVFLWFSWIWSLLLSRLALMILMRRSTFRFLFLCAKERCKKWTRRITMNTRLRLDFPTCPECSTLPNTSQHFTSQIFPTCPECSTSKTRKCQEPNCSALRHSAWGVDQRCGDLAGHAASEPGSECGTLAVPCCSVLFHAVLMVSGW